MGLLVLYIGILQTAHSRADAGVVYLRVVECTRCYTFTPFLWYFTYPGRRIPLGAYIIDNISFGALVSSLTNHSVIVAIAHVFAVPVQCQAHHGQWHNDD